VGLTLIEAFVAAQGDGDAGAELEFDNHLLHRLKDSHTRRYLSIFGELLMKRRVYACREGQKVEQAPLDERLVHHPASRFLYSSGNTRLASLRLKVQLILVFFRLRSRDQWEASY
jgi:hypothetical protein